MEIIYVIFAVLAVCLVVAGFNGALINPFKPSKNPQWNYPYHLEDEEIRRKYSSCRVEDENLEN